MTVGQIKTRVATILQKSVVDFVVGEDDMLYMALNNARLFAEQSHDFERSKDIIQLTVSSPQGVNLSTATLLNTTVPANVKSIINCSVVGTDGSMLPIDFRKRDSVMAELRKDSRTDTSYFWGRYPPDFGVENQAVMMEGIREVMQFNQTVMLRPMLSSGSVVLACEAYLWFPEYQQDSDVDFFTQHGFNYLIWQSVVEANHLAKEFVYRQEGNLQPPDKLADKYLQGLINFDLFSVDQNVDVTAD